MRKPSRVEIAGTTNVRDLGGYPAREGTRVRPGMFFRGEALARPGTTAKVALWSDEHVDAYRTLGLHTVIDLRADSESALAPSAWADASGARLVRLPVNEGGEGDATDFMRRLRAGTLRAFGADDLAAYYAQTVRRRANVFGRAIEVLAAPDALPALVHCSAGKDRTGILVALVLEVLGTPREIVVEEYALTAVLRPNRVAAYADVLATHGIEPAAVAALFDSPAAAMRALLAGLDAEFGSVAEFLERAAGVERRMLDALATALLTDGSP